MKLNISELRIIISPTDLSSRVDTLEKNLTRKLDLIMGSLKIVQQNQQTEGRQEMAIHETLQTIIQQAQSNHDVEISATEAIHKLLNELEDQASQGDLDAVQQTLQAMKGSAGQLAAAIASTDQGQGQGQASQGQGQGTTGSSASASGGSSSSTGGDAGGAGNTGTTDNTTTTTVTTDSSGGTSDQGTGGAV